MTSRHSPPRGPIRDMGWEMLGDVDVDGAEFPGWRFTEQLKGRALREPIAGWRSKARQLGALLRAAAALQHGDAPALTDLQLMLYGGRISSDGSRRLGTRITAPAGKQTDLAVRRRNDDRWKLILLIAAEWLPLDDLRVGLSPIGKP